MWEVKVLFSRGWTLAQEKSRIRAAFVQICRLDLLGAEATKTLVKAGNHTTSIKDAVLASPSWM